MTKPAANFTFPAVMDKRHPSALWIEARRLAESGMYLSEIAEKLNIPKKSVETKSYSQQWKTPGRLARKARKATGLKNKPVELPATLGETPSQPALAGQLAATAARAPGPYQEAVANLAEYLMAQGAPELRPPATVTEFGKWFEIARKARGLDRLETQDNRFVRPVRSLLRRPVVDVEEVPGVEEGAKGQSASEASGLDGFEI